MVVRCGKLLLIILSLLLVTACDENSLAFEPLHIQVETKIEKGTKVSLTIFFKEKPDEEVLNFPQISGLELYGGSKNIIDDIREPIESGSEFKYAYYAYVRALNVGKITFPALTIHHNGQQFQSSPVDIDIVDHIQILPDDVKLVLSASKKIVKVGDPISLKVELYSAFSLVNYAQNFMNEIRIAGEDNAIKIEKVIDVELKSGIKGLEKVLDSYFDIDDFDMDFTVQDRMVLLNNKRYFKQLLTGLELIAIKTGIVELGASCLQFDVYVNNDNYFDQFYTKENLAQPISVCSEPLKITIVP